MTGWLPREILDHLHMAGYVAIPKERVEEFYVEEVGDRYELAMTHPADRASLNDARAKRMAFQLGMQLWTKGFVTTEFDRVKGDNFCIRNRASIQVIKPRTIT